MACNLGSYIVNCYVESSSYIHFLILSSYQLIYMILLYTLSHLVGPQYSFTRWIGLSLDTNTFKLCSI